MKSIIACALVFNLNSPLNAMPDSSTLEFQQVAASKNLSQLLRSNTLHFWAFSSNPKVLKDLNYYTDAVGVINGDPHVGNFTVIPVKTTEGKNVFRFLNVDFDDGGYGSFALEFSLFTTMAKASSKEIRFNDLFDSYVEGLKGKERAMPSRIKKAESVKYEDYENARRAYVEKKMQRGRFKYEEGEIEKWDGRPNINDIQPLFSRGVKVIEVARRPIERGGSADGLRLWVLIQDSNGIYRVVELKQYMEPTLSSYRPQGVPEKRLSFLREIFWEGIDSSSYDLVNVLGTSYWIREKKVEILTYKNKSEEDEARIYLANRMGLIQSKQSQGPHLLKKISKDPERFKAAIKEYYKTYLGLAEDTMGK